MRIKRIIAFVLIVIAITVVSTTIYYAKSKNKLTYGNKTSVSEAYNQRAMKVEERLNDAYQDILQTHKIDDSEYTVFVDGSNFIDFLNRKNEGFTDMNKINDINLLVRDIKQSIPLGSTLATILVTQDLDDVMVCYKEPDGTNVVYKAKKNGNDWNIISDKVKGKPIMEITK